MHLRIPNAFKMDLIIDEGDTQISITWNDQDQKRVEEDFCEGYKTKGLRLMIGGLVEKLVGVMKVEVVVNKPRVAAYRAPGAPQSVYAAESVLDELAEILDIDPLDFRIKNAATKGTQSAYGPKFQEIGFQSTEIPFAAVN